MELEIFASLKVYQLILATGIFPFGSSSSLQDTLIVCQVSTVSLTLYASISSSQLQKLKTLVFERVENLFSAGDNCDSIDTGPSQRSVQAWLFGWVAGGPKCTHADR